MRRAVILTALLAVLLPVISPFRATVTAASPKGADQAAAKLAERAKKIEVNDRYYHGVGYGETDEDAKNAALQDLCSKISLSIAGIATSKETLDDEEYSNVGIISTFATLSNTERIDLSTEPGKWKVFLYVEKSQVENDMAMRDERIRTLVEQAKSLESRLEIGSALKYYNWAYALSKCTQRPTMLDMDGKAKVAREWLDGHINTIFTNLDVTLAGVTEDPASDLDPYVVTLNINYGGQPVADLDFSYINDGLKVTGQHVKNGKAELAFSKLPAKKIDMTVEHMYQDGVTEYDTELKTIFKARGVKPFPKAKLEIPCKGVTPEKFEVKERKLTKEEAREAKAAAEMAPPVAAPVITRIQTQQLGDSRGHNLAMAMEKIWDAIGVGSFASVRDLFTTDGYALFLKMMQSGKVKKAAVKPELKIELAGNYVVGKSLPVTVTYNGGHKVSEEIVCRFNSDNKIESVAYALSRRAEDDIFKQNAWDLSARYAILHFMEDYQTAYALKRLDYIKSIYSDDAVIISGVRKDNSRKSTDSGRYFMTDEFTYTRETKDEFIKKLDSQFFGPKAKRYIKLTFEDNEIREQSGIYQNIFWIEIKQFYSSSDYNDVGYLSLMIDMRQADPTIKVRTWAPGKIPLKDLMSRFTIE